MEFDDLTMQGMWRWFAELAPAKDPANWSNASNKRKLARGGATNSVLVDCPECGQPEALGERRGSRDRSHPADSAGRMECAASVRVNW